MFWHTEDPFASGLHSWGHPSKPLPVAPHYPFRSRARHQSRRPGLAREDELLRRQLYQHELDQRAARAREEQGRSRQLHRRRALAQHEHARHRRRLTMFTFTVAARKIQRWWRGIAAARRTVAAAKVAEALSRNVAVRQGRRVTESLRRLTELEATIDSLPNPGAEQLSKRVSGKGISMFENTLERLILSADNIPTHGSDAARTIRKRLVRTANTRLQAFDNEVVAAKAAEAERAAEQEAEQEVDTDEDTAGSETGESESGAAVSPVDVTPQTAEVEWDEAGRECVATTMGAESQACLAPPPSPPGGGQPLLQTPSPTGPRDKFLGMPASISTRHKSTSENNTDTDDSNGDEDLVNAAIADLIAPRPLGSNGQCRGQVGRVFQSTGHKTSEIEPEIEPDSSDSDSSFVEVRPVSEDEDEDKAFRCMYAKISVGQQDHGGESAEMDLDSDPPMPQVCATETDAEVAAAVASRFNALVAEFADELADIELQHQQTPGGVCNAARDLQAAIRAILPTVRGGN